MSSVPAETVFVAWLKAAFPSARVVTETPSNLEDVLPCIAVSRFGGTDEVFASFDNPSMDFDCYAPTRAEARSLAYAVRDSIRNDLPGQIVAGAFVSRTRSVAAPVFTPYDNTGLRRFTYSAQARLHSLEA